ncbi:FAD-binding oxidoreductase [Methylocaldum sp. 14B]|uniref:FAD-binding oxidoreductase n=1 Tax=Methylocaldum sp. 14B TaxID=1912213 RepID=UPI00098AE1F0|nr:FAD-binding oxidoreductase [Methylocaldum sp. 14B]
MVHSILNATAAEALAIAIRKRVRGEVRFDFRSRALYAADAADYQQMPIGVVIPRDVNDVVETVAACRKHDTPITTHGGGTRLAVPWRNSVVIIDMSKYLRGVLAIDPSRQRAVVEPGCALDSLRSKAEEHRLTFGPDPSNHAHCTLGGMIGSNACGLHSVMAGHTADNVYRLDILTYDGLRMTVGPTSEEDLEAIIRGGGRRGEIYAGLKALRDKYADTIRARFPKIPRRLSGYAIDQLLPENGFNLARALVGTEETCVIVLHAELRLVPSPPVRTLLVLGYPDIFRAADHIAELMAFKPIGLEGIDDSLVRSMKAKQMRLEELQLLPAGRGWLILEFGGETQEESAGRARQLMDELRCKPGAPSMKLLDDPRDEARIRKFREAGLTATTHGAGLRMVRPIWEDAAVHPQDVGPYLREYRALLDKYGYRCSLYGHFGEGCIHYRIDFIAHERIRHWRAFVDEKTDLVVRYNGSLSTEQADEPAQADLLPKLYGDALVQAFREFKAIWDPQNRMNPGRVMDSFSYARPLHLRRAM